MDLTLEKIDYFISELEILLNKEFEFDCHKGLNGKTIRTNVVNFIRLNIYNFIQENKVLNEYYKKKISYYYDLKDNEEYLNCFRALLGHTIILYESLNIQNLENFKYKRSYDSLIFPIFSKEPIDLHDKFAQRVPIDEMYYPVLNFQEFIEIMINEKSYENLNPDTENIAQLIKQFEISNTLTVIDSLIESIPCDELFSGKFDVIDSEGIYRAIKDEMSKEIYTLKKLLIDIPVLNGVNYFSIFDKFCYVNNTIETFDNYKKYYDCLFLVEIKTAYDGIINPTIKLLKDLRWHYIEYTGNKTNDIDNTENPAILNLLLKRFTNAQIAKELNIAVGTVKNILNECYSSYDISGKIKGKRDKLIAILESKNYER